MNIIAAAAAELDRVQIEDALRILVVMAKGRDPRYGRAAAKWVARVTEERKLEIDASRRLLALAECLPEAPDAVEPVLRRLSAG